PLRRSLRVETPPLGVPSLPTRRSSDLLRHALRRGTVAVRRVAVHLRAYVPRSGGPPGRRSDRADPTRGRPLAEEPGADGALDGRDRKSTRLNSSHAWISYAVFCLKKKK